MSLPTVSPELAAALDKLFPARVPDPRWSDREIWLYTGKRLLVELLQAEAIRQQDDITRTAQ